MVIIIKRRLRVRVTTKEQLPIYVPSSMKHPTCTFQNPLQQKPLTHSEVYSGFSLFPKILNPLSTLLYHHSIFMQMASNKTTTFALMVHSADSTTDFSRSRSWFCNTYPENNLTESLEPPLTRKVYFVQIILTYLDLGLKKSTLSFQLCLRKQ